MKRSRSRIAAIAGLVGILPALIIVALLAFEFSIPIDGYRARVATALSDALGCPLTIGGSLHLVTGTRPGIEGRDVRLEECRTIRVARASADRVRVRVDLWALFSHEIRLAEIAGERLEAEVPTQAPAPAATPAGEPSRWNFVEIRRLYVTPARLLVRRVGAPPRSFDLSEVEGSARAGERMRLTLRGTRERELWDATATTASLRDALAGVERWPLDLKASYAAATASLSGTWTPAPIGVEGDLAVASAAAERVFRAFGREAPELGKIDVTGRLTASADSVSLDALHFSGPVGAVSGNARIVTGAERPVVTVSLSAGDVDYAALERWRAAGRGSGSVGDIVTRTLERLRAFDGEFTASFGRLTNAPFEMTDFEHSAHLKAGQLKFTNTATVDGAPGKLSVDVDARGPFAIEARASVTALPHAAATRAEIDPRIGGLSATLSAKGATAETLLEDVHGQVSGKDIKLVLPLWDERRAVRLRTVELVAGRGEAMRARAAGTLAGESLELELTAGRLLDLLEDRTWSVERLRGRVGTARVQASGRIDRPLTARSARLDVEVAVSRLDQLAPLVGGAGLPRVPGTLRGSIDFQVDAWRVDATTLAIGATRGTGHASGKRGAPIMVTLDLQSVAGDELAEFGKSAGPTSSEKRPVSLPDLDLSLKTRKADYGGQAFENLAINVVVREDTVRGPFTLDWAGARVEGKLDASFGKDTVRLDGDVAARGLDLARLPGPFAKQEITGRIDRLSARVEASAASAAALPANAAISIEATDASLILPKSDAFPRGAHLTFGGEAHASAAAPIDFSIKGMLRDKQFEASGQLPALDALYPAGKPHAVRLVIDYDRTRLEAAGNATIDKDAPRFSGKVNLSGDTLHTLADLAGFSARGFGPYKVTAGVAAGDAGIDAKDVTVQLGKSAFRASLSVGKSKERPRVAAKVHGQPVHLEDIGAKAWSPENVEKRAVSETRSGEKVDQAVLDRDARVLTRVLRAFDFDLDVAFDEVSAAGEVVGRAEVKAKLAAGQLEVNPANLWIDEGKFSAEIGVDVRGKVPQYAVKFEGSGFDYGPFMRAVDAKSPHDGTLYLSVDIKTSGAPETLVQNATGEFDVLILPKNQEAGSLSLLGAGALRLLLQTLDPRSQSQLNCIVGSFGLDKGIATSHVVLLDTTLARVAGELVIDYRTRALRGRFAPSSKRPQVFSVAPGITVGGTLDAPDIGVSPQSIVVGALRVWQFPLAFASDWLSSENIPADGTPDCRAAYRHVLH